MVAPCRNCESDIKKEYGYRCHSVCELYLAFFKEREMRRNEHKTEMDICAYMQASAKRVSRQPYKDLTKPKKG